MSNEINLKELISQNKIDKALEVLLQIEEGKNISDEIYHLKNRIKRLENQRNKGVLSQENYDTEFNKIVDSSLGLIKVAFHSSRVPMPIEQDKKLEIFLSWDFKVKKEFIQILLESQTFRSREMRNSFIAELPVEIKSRVNSDGPPLIEMKNILETTLSFENGWEVFLKLFEAFEGKSTAISKMKSFVKSQNNEK